jgi:hypothetical protein
LEEFRWKISGVVAACTHRQLLLSPNFTVIAQWA